MTAVSDPRRRDWQLGTRIVPAARVRTACVDGTGHGVAIFQFPRCCHSCTVADTSQTVAYSDEAKVGSKEPVTMRTSEALSGTT